ncbi:DoxX family protein [Arcticibacter sp. MXS-1]|uniref:DoxX family protein n=1 Tax=Arcticibacter sp. MXS-1 TaxID=3341726 RepID=UPI0035A8A229
MIKKLLETDRSSGTIFIRIMIGTVFLSEGIQKFLFPAAVGAGRFSKIGLPSPETWATAVGTTEIVCGALVLMGLLSRLATVPLIAIMLSALTLTKVEILAEQGIWKMFHESRTDWAMLLGNIFLLIKGAGRWSFDRALSNS